MRILVVDNYPDSVSTFTLLFQVWGHEAQGIQRASLVIPAALVFQPEVAFLDLEVDGYEIARQMRREPWLKGIVLIAMTGGHLAEDRARAYEAGFNAFVFKPVPPLRLKRFLEKPPPPSSWPTAEAIEDLERYERGGVSK